MQSPPPERGAHLESFANRTAHTPLRTKQPAKQVGRYAKSL